MSRSTTALISFGVVAILVASPAAHAQMTHVRRAAGDTVSYNRELRSYVLTMDRLRKFKQAGMTIATLAKAHPDAAERWGDLGGSGSLDDQVHQMEAIAPVSQAITAAGLTVRDYLLTSITFFQAGMAAAMEDGYRKANQNPPALPGNVNPANVRFLQTHKAEVEALKLGAMAGDASS
jgi:hypothetical protein